jgi:hypothetical protein
VRNHIESVHEGKKDKTENLIFVMHVPCGESYVAERDLTWHIANIHDKLDILIIFCVDNVEQSQVKKNLSTNHL